MLGDWRTAPRARALLARWLGVTAWGTAWIGATACITQDDAKKLVAALEAARPARPDVAPVMLTREPIRYPASMYAQRAQGNVTLRIFVDSTGRVRPESTQVAETSGVPAFDSAAVAGARDVRFSPARRKGTPVAVSVMFPVYFRHPQGPPILGDSVLHGGQGSTYAPVSPRGDSVGR
jgi:TonB family protein